MKRLAVVVALAMVGGCQESAGPVVTPDGKTAHTAKCSQNPQNCMAEAGKTCGGAYQVVDSYSKSGGLAADILPGPVTWFYMTYQCGRSDGRMPQFPFRGQQYNPPATASCTTIGNTTNCYSY